MFLIVPYHVDVPMRCMPWMNWILIGLTVIFFPICINRDGFTPFGEHLVLNGDSWFGYIGHVLVHIDIWHLLGNMLFLWVFGNAVCAKVGNFTYFFVYFGLGLASGLVSSLIDSREGVGASGAINGVVGMFVVWYTVNEISCWYSYWFFTAVGSGSYSVSSYWMVLMWLMFDIWGAIRGGSNIGFVAHLSGFAVGFALAILLLVWRLVEMERGEQSLLQLITGQEIQPQKKKKKKHRIRRDIESRRPHVGDSESYTAD